MREDVNFLIQKYLVTRDPNDAVLLANYLGEIQGKKQSVAWVIEIEEEDESTKFELFYTQEAALRWAASWALNYIDQDIEDLNQNIHVESGGVRSNKWFLAPRTLRHLIQKLLDERKYRALARLLLRFTFDYLPSYTDLSVFSKEIN